jgi:hypothetical protein
VAPPAPLGPCRAGWQGAQQLLRAGYSAVQLLAPGCYSLYEVSKAGAGEAELRQAHVPVAVIRQAGLGPPELQPLQPSVLGIRPAVQIAAGQLQPVWGGWGGSRPRSGMPGNSRPQSGASAAGSSGGGSEGAAARRPRSSSGNAPAAAVIRSRPGSATSVDYAV